MPVVSLSEGDGVLNDPLALSVEDATGEGEQCFTIIELNVVGSPPVVDYPPRGDGVRTISVRTADARERRNYEKGR